MHLCVNHPQNPCDAPCAGCGRPFCGGCLTEMSGQRVCGWCRDSRIRNLQSNRPTDAAAVVLWARIFDGFCALGGGGMCLMLGVVYLIPMFVIRASPSAASSVTFTGILSLVFLALGVVSLAIYTPPAVMLRPGRGWTWTWQFVALILSLIGGVLTITSFGIVLLGCGIPLMIFWLRPEVRAYLDQAS